VRHFRVRSAFFGIASGEQIRNERPSIAWMTLEPREFESAGTTSPGNAPPATARGALKHEATGGARGLA
jgi:hypothetical protein